MDEAKLQEIEARTNAATPGPWEVTEIRDGRQSDGIEELGVFAPSDPRSYRKPDGTWHGTLICRGMDGPTREPNAQFIAHAREDVRDLVAEVERLTAALDVVTAERDGLWTRLGAHEGALHDTIARLRDEKAELRTQVDVAGDAQQRIAAAWNQIAGHFLVSPNPANAERIARLACAAADVRDEATATRDEAVAELQRLRAEHAAALATARREGAEEMRERCAAAMLATNTLPAWESWQSALDAIRALPLDRDGGTP